MKKIIIILIVFFVTSCVTQQSFLNHLEADIGTITLSFSKDASVYSDGSISDVWYERNTKVWIWKDNVKIGQSDSYISYEFKIIKYKKDNENIVLYLRDNYIGDLYDRDYYSTILQFSTNLPRNSMIRSDVVTRYYLK